MFVLTRARFLIPNKEFSRSQDQAHVRKILYY
mgnify:CR=1 FL=1